MFLLKVGYPTFLLGGASLLVILTSHILLAPDHSTSKSNGSETNVTFTVPQVDISSTKVAITFGSKTLFRGSLANVSTVITSLHKRDAWTDAVDNGRRLYAGILSRRTLPSHFVEKRWLTGFWPENSRDTAHRTGWGLLGADGFPPEGFPPEPETPVITPLDGFLPDAPSPEGSSDEGSSPGSSSSKSDPFKDNPLVNETPDSFQQAFNDLHIPQGAANLKWQAYQNMTFINCYGSGKEATYGSFNNYYNVPGRTITATLNYSPAYRVKQLHENANRPLPPNWDRLLPFVSRWSDVTWIIWADLCQRAGSPPGSLKYIFRHYVITAQTKLVMERAVDSHFSNWPGARFTPQDDQYMALLATAHGKGIVNLLTQHPVELGHKSIESVIVFATNSYRQHLLFTLTD